MYIESCVRFLVHTILGLAGAVVWLRQVTLHTGACVGAVSVDTGLTAGPIHTALIEVWATETTHGRIAQLLVLSQIKTYITSDKDIDVLANTTNASFYCLSHAWLPPGSRNDSLKYAISNILPDLCIKRP